MGDVSNHRSVKRMIVMGMSDQHGINIGYTCQFKFIFNHPTVGSNLPEKSGKHPGTGKKAVHHESRDPVRDKDGRIAEVGCLHAGAADGCKWARVDLGVSKRVIATAGS